MAHDLQSLSPSLFYEEPFYVKIFLFSHFPKPVSKISFSHSTLAPADASKSIVKKKMMI
jgi:hypothetical protein